MNDIKVGDNVKKYRKESGLTQQELANQSGVSIATIKTCETNKNTPKYNTLKKIASVLNVSVNKLLYTGINSNFSNELTYLRCKKGLTQEQLGELIGVSGTAIMRYEKNQRSPSYNLLLRIAGVFDVSVDELISSEVTESKEIIELKSLADYSTEELLAEIKRRCCI